MPHTTTTTPIPASEAGALPGFKIICEECGDAGTSTFESSARLLAEAHTAYWKGR